jgi:hypothetical protein
MKSVKVTKSSVNKPTGRLGTRTPAGLLSTQPASYTGEELVDMFAKMQKQVNEIQEKLLSMVDLVSRIHEAIFPEHPKNELGEQKYVQ